MAQKKEENMKRKREYLFEMFEQEWTCPISSIPIVDPVVTSDGHTYEKSQITKWLKKQKTSPKTGLKLPTAKILPNIALKSVIGKFEKQIKYEIEKIICENKQHIEKIKQLQQKVGSLQNQLLKQKQQGDKLRNRIQQYQKSEQLKNKDIILETTTKVQKPSVVQTQQASTMTQNQLQDEDDEDLDESQFESDFFDDSQQQQNSEQLDNNQNQSNQQKPQNYQQQKVQSSSIFNNKEIQKNLIQLQNHKLSHHPQKYSSNKPSYLKAQSNEELDGRGKQMISQLRKKNQKGWMVQFQPQQQKKRQKESLKIRQQKLRPFEQYLLEHPALYEQKTRTLDHSYHKINMNQFFAYNWQLLRQLNLQNSNLNDQKFQQLVNSLDRKLITLQRLNVSDNNIIQISNQTIKKLSSLQQIRFIKYHASKKSKLSSKTKINLALFTTHHRKINVIY